MPGDDETRKFRALVLAAHRPAFDLHMNVLRRFEEAMVSTRELSNPTRTALDMLMYQAFKSSGALSLLTQHALLEDAATINRRLMELAITATYIYGDGVEADQASRAARYLVHMWRQLPEQALRQLSEQAIAEWRELDASVGDTLPAKARRWGPLWKDMFTDVGATDLYQEDYTFLSSMAHGSPDDLILLFSHRTIRVHRHGHASTLLKFGTRYLMIVGGMWNNVFGVIPDKEIEQLLAETSKDHPKSAEDAS